jgi:hypothetical protein
MALVVIDSTPAGAEVFGPDKKSVGKTPAHITLPISDLPQNFELKLAGYKKKSKQLIVSGNAVIQVTLERAPSGAVHKKDTSDRENALMKPDDL